VPPRSPRKRFADRLLGLPVETFIAERRANGDSYRRIALDLLDATSGEIDVTDVTVRSWHQEAEATAAARPTSHPPDLPLAVTA
jgi:hypothetical protein